MHKDRTFKTRNFVSLLTTLSGLAMVISGIVLYIVPEGRVAYWADWRLFDLGKEQWGSMHTILSLVFFVAALLHGYYNWGALMAYLKDRTRQTLSLRKELLAALALTLLCIHGSIAGYAPFGQVMQAGKAIKKSWYAGQEVHPPFPHAELMPLKQLAKKVDFSLNGALAYLHGQGFTESGATTTLKQLSETHGQSPAQIFEAMMMDDRLYQ